MLLTTSYKIKMKKRNSSKHPKTQIYIKIFISYIIVLCIPIVWGLLLYAQTLKQSREQAETINQNLMGIVKTECDNKMSQTIQTLDRIAMDRNIQILSARKEFETNDQYTLWTVYQDLSNSNFVDGNYRDIFVYFKNTDRVISKSGSMTLNMFHELFYKDTEMNLTQFRTYLSDSHFHDIRLIEEDNRKKSVLCTLTSLNSTLGEDTATIAIRMDVADLDQIVEAAKWNDELLFGILNSDNQLINTVNEEEPFLNLSYIGMTDKGDMKLRLGKEACTAKIVISDVAEWKYVAIMPERVLMADAQKVQQLGIMGLFLCIFTGFAFSHFLTNRNYNPLKKLIEIFQSQTNQNEVAYEVKNEYRWLEEQTRMIFKEHGDIKKDLKEHRKKVRKFYLFKLLLHSEGNLDTAVVRKSLENLKSNYNIVILLKGEVEETLTDELRSFILSNIAEEILTENFNVESLDMGECVALIVNLPNAHNETMNELRENLEIISQKTEEFFHFQTYALAGSVKKELEEIHFSYLEAKEAEEYLSLLDGNTIFYQDIRNMNKKYDYSLESETKILNAIRAGNAESAKKTVKEILERNSMRNSLSSQGYKCLLYDLMGTMMKSADETGAGNPFDSEDDSFTISIKKSREENVQEFYRIIELLCQKNGEESDKGGKQISEVILEYVQNHYQDHDINISQIALSMNMTPAYISTVFKRQTGKSLLNMINTIRVEKAEEYLKAGHSVTETAEMVGYRESRSFIRIFKKMKGITPGQLKKMEERGVKL